MLWLLEDSYQERMKSKVICLFGSYDIGYSRNYLIIKALNKLGYKVIHINSSQKLLKHYLFLVKSFIKNYKEFPIVFIPTLGHYQVPIAWVLAKLFNKKLLFDAFYSLYDTYINDRKIAKPFSLKAFRFYFYDLLATRLADKIILDTQENIDYFVKKYKADRRKFFELPVTADPDIFKPKKLKKRKNYTVGFYGSFMPLHGVELIVKSFKHLRDSNVKCILWGIGPEIKKIKVLIKKLKLEDRIALINQKIEYSMLSDYFEKVDLFLAGPFGLSEKAKRVIPAKIAEALSSGIPTIVAMTPATAKGLDGIAGIIWLDHVSARNLALKILQSKKMTKKPHDIRNNFLKSPLSFKSFKSRLIHFINSTQRYE